MESGDDCPRSPSRSWYSISEVKNMPDTVLIITNDHDEHADAVVAELNRRDVPVFRFHPADFPHACSVSLEIQEGRVQGELRTADRRVGFEEICAAWYRRAGNLFETRL